MKRAAIQWIRNVVAIALVICGLVGLALPIIPQIPFFVAAVLVADFERKRAVVRWICSRRWIRKIGGEKLHRLLNRRRPEPVNKTG